MLPFYVDIIECVCGDTDDIEIIGQGGTPAEALATLYDDLAHGRRLSVPEHSVYLNTSLLPTSLERIYQLILSDPFLHSVYQLGKQQGAAERKSND